MGGECQIQLSEDVDPDVEEVVEVPPEELEVESEFEPEPEPEPELDELLPDEEAEDPERLSVL